MPARLKPALLAYHSYRQVKLSKLFAQRNSRPTDYPVIKHVQIETITLSEIQSQIVAIGQCHVAVVLRQKESHQLSSVGVILYKQYLRWLRDRRSSGEDTCSRSLYGAGRLNYATTPAPLCVRPCWSLRSRRWLPASRSRETSRFVCPILHP